MQTCMLPVIASVLITLVKILSIRDSVEDVILVGRDISGKRKLLVIRSKKSDTSESAFNFERLMLISPAIDIFSLFLTPVPNGQGPISLAL